MSGGVPDCGRGSHRAPAREMVTKMTMMQNQDEVIRQCAACSDAQGIEVRSALTAYVASQTPETERALRVALVAQSAGHEAGSHDGATFARRKTAANLALEAWDGTGPLAEGQVAHSLGGTRIVASAELWRLAGFSLSHYAQGGPLHVSGTTGHNGYEPRRLAQALSEGYSHESALLRAIALGEASSAERSSNHSRLEAARFQARAAEEQVHAEAIRAKLARET